jgi:hypothetical protein
LFASSRGIYISIQWSLSLVMISRFSILILIGFTCISGCARWNRTEEKRELSFPKGRMALDAVGLELGVAQLDSGQAETFEEFWNLLDQLELPLELRKHLDQNGLRAGIMAALPPPMLHELVEPKPIAPDDLSEFEKQLHLRGLLRPSPRMITHDRISNREGQSHPIPVSELHAESSWIVRTGDKQTAGFAKQVLGVLTVTTFPQGDGSVRLIFQPEIHHGESRPRIVGGERSFLVESGQSVIPIHDLKFEVRLRAGESIIIAPTQDLSELGKLFFGSSVPESDGAKNSTPTHRILMVRVVQTQMDDLFSDSNLVEKLTTAPQH